MNIKEINDCHRRVADMLRDGMIASAISQLETLMDALGDGKYRSELDDIRNTYGMLLHYFVAGMPDPGRRELSQSLRQRLSRLNDRLNYRGLSASMDSDYFSLVRSSSLASATVSSALADTETALRRLLVEDDSDETLRKDYQEAVYRLFNKVMVTQFLSKEETDILSSYLCKNGDSIEETSLLVMSQSALAGSLYLGCMQYYDPMKLRLLITVLLNNSGDEVLSRAYVLLLILLTRYPQQVEADKRLRSLLGLLADADNFHDVMMEVAEGFIRCVDTARINKTITDEIIPGLIRMRPEIEEGFRKMEKDMEADDQDMNPQWEELLRKSGLEEKMRQLNDMQMEGADMFMMAFAKMKSLPFFRNPANWFIPFDASHTAVSDSVRRMPGDFTAMLAASAVFCDTDCYSLFLGLKMMPSDAVEMMSQQIRSQIQGVEEERKASFAESTRPGLKVAIGRFLRDLYRFYNQYHNASRYFNPFAQAPDFTTIPVAGASIANPSDLEYLGSLLFSRKMWAQASSLFARFEEHEEGLLASCRKITNPEYYLSYRGLGDGSSEEEALASVLERHGYALMRLYRWQEALPTLMAAQYFRQPSGWIVSKIAECLANTGQRPLSGQFYDYALSLDPDNRRLLLRRSRQLIEDGDYSRAQKLMYKLHYFAPDNSLYIRILAWCRLLQEDAAKALELYRSIPAGKEEDNDVINIGHALFASGDYEGCTDCYADYIARTDASRFLRTLKEDARVVPALMASEEALAWVRDAALLRSGR